MAASSGLRSPVKRLGYLELESELLEAKQGAGRGMARHGWGIIDGLSGLDHRHAWSASSQDFWDSVIGRHA
jgi:hypothetical protein